MNRLNRLSGKQKLTGVCLAMIAIVAWAKTWGPFYVASAGPQYAGYTFAEDTIEEYEAAYALASIYLWKNTSMTDAFKKSIIGNKDLIRVVYADGQIADFTAADMTTAGMRLKQKVSSVTTKDYVSLTADQRCAAIMAGRNSITFDTGYWGTISSEATGDNEITTTGGWISTGSVTVSIPPSVNCY